MANELENINRVQIEYTPATLEINNYDELKRLVEDYAERYNSLLVDEEDRPGLTQSRSELLGLHKALDNQRLEIKREYNKPLDAVEGKFKYLTDLIDKPLEITRKSIKVLDENEKLERKKTLNDYLEKQVNRVNADNEIPIEIDDIERNDKWLNKGSWTDSLEPKQATKEQILAEVDTAVKAKKHRQMEIDVITELCKAKEIDPAGWVAQLDFKTASELIKDINDLEAQQKEEARKIEQAEAEQNEVTGAPELDTLDLPGTVKKPEKITIHETLIVNTIEVTGTHEQLMALNKYLNESGISVRQVG